jgi:cyclase
VLKTRVIPTLLYRDYGLVKGERFDGSRHIGHPRQAIKIYEMRGVDELVLLDIAATSHGTGPDFELVDDLADDCFMPFSVGGGVRDADDVGRLLAVGADKVVINTALVEAPAIVEESVARYGSQCVVASIDTKVTDVSEAEACTRSGTQPTGIDGAVLARRAAELGAGEILLTSVDRDGTMTGYDLATIARVAESVNVPVIASGGAGSYDDLVRALEAGATAVAAAAMFHFTQQTPHEAKQHLHDSGFPVRL